MSDAPKVKYLTKTVKFGGKSMTLYSLDGFTWSTRKTELLTVKERLENQRVTLIQGKSGEGEEEKEENEEKEESEEESSEAGDGPVEINMNDDDDDAYEDDDAEAKPKGNKKAKSKLEVVKPAAKANPAAKTIKHAPKKAVPVKTKAISKPKARVSGKPAKAAKLNQKAKKKAA